jgi:hypothetical protein
VKRSKGVKRSKKKEAKKGKKKQRSEEGNRKKTDHIREFGGFELEGDEVDTPTHRNRLDVIQNFLADFSTSFTVVLGVLTQITRIRVVLLWFGFVHSFHVH